MFTVNNDSSNGLVTFWNENGDDEIFAHNSSMLPEHDYRKLGETWSTPRIVKLKIDGADKWVAKLEVVITEQLIQIMDQLYL